MSVVPFTLRVCIKEKHIANVSLTVREFKPQARSGSSGLFMHLFLETEFYRLTAHSSAQVRAGPRIALSGQNRGTEADLSWSRVLQMFALSPLLDKFTGEGTRS